MLLKSPCVFKYMTNSYLNCTDVLTSGVDAEVEGGVDQLRGSHGGNSWLRLQTRQIL